MKNITKILGLAGLVLGITFYANAQKSAESNQKDTIISSKTFSVIEEKSNKSKSILEKKEYVIENTSQIVGDKVILENEVRYSFKEKDFGRPVDPKEPKNILNRKQTDKLLDYTSLSQFKYDSLGRLIEIMKMEEYSPGEDKKKRSKIFYTYEGANKTPVKIWEDLNNNGKFDAGDKIRVYISELDKWVSQED